MTVVGAAYVEVAPLTTDFAASLKTQITAATDEVAAANAGTFDKLAESADSATRQVGTAVEGMAATVTDAAATVTKADDTMAASATKTATLTVDAQGKMRNARGQYASEAEIAAGTVAGADGKVIASQEAVRSKTVETSGFMAAFSKGTAGAFAAIGSAVGTFIPPLGKAFDNMGEHIQAADTKVSGFRASLEELGKVATLGGLAALGVVSYEAVKAATNFQSASEHLVTDAGEAQANMKMIQDGMLQISASTGTSITDIVNGMYHIESSGQHGAAALTILRTAAEGAKVGGADLDTVGKTLTGTLNSLHEPASSATSLMNELIATVSSGDLRMQDLASSLGNVVPIAAKAGLSFAQVGGAIATMTAQNMSANQATQDLNNLIGNLNAPSHVATAEMAQFGINANTVSQQLGQKGLTGTIGELTEAITSKMGASGLVLMNAFNQSQGAAADMRTEISKMSPQLAAMAKSFIDGKLTVADWRTSIKALPADQQAMANGFVQTYDQAHKFNQLLTSGSPAALTFNAALEKMTGGSTGLTTALMLSGGSMGTFKDNVKTIQEAADRSGKSVNDWATIQGTLKQQIDVGVKSVEALGIQYGMFLIPIIEKVISVVSQVVTWLSQHKTIALILAGVIAGPLVLAIGAYTIAMIEAAAMTIAATWPILAIVAAAAILGAGIYELVTHWHEVTKAVEDFIEKHKILAAIIAIPLAPLIIVIGEIVAAIKYWHDITQWAVDAWNHTWGAAIDVIHALTGAWNDTWAAVSGAFNDTLGALTDAWNSTLGAIADAWNSTWGAVTGAYQAVYKVIADITGTIGDVFSDIGSTISDTVVAAFDFFRDSVVSVWGVISGVFSAIANAVLNVLAVPFSIFSKIVEISFVAVEDIILLAWMGMQVVFNAISGALRGPLTAAFDLLWHGVIEPVWDGIYKAISASWSLISRVFDLLVYRVQTGLANIFDFLWHGVIDPTWQGIVGVIEAAWAAIEGVFNAIVASVENVLGAAFAFLWHDIMQPVWQGITTVIQTAWNIIQGIWNTMVGFVNTVIVQTFENLWHNTMTPVWDGIRDAISSVWDGIKGTFNSMVGFVTNDIPNAFRTLRTTLSGIWGDIQTDTSTAWGKITDIFKTPVNLLITGLNDLIDGVNDISGLVGNSTHITRITPLATGGYITDGPALVGEGNPRFPEVVVATDPAFRSRNVELAKVAARAVGLPMLAHGGIVGDITSGISSAIGGVTGGISSAVSFAGGLASQAASLIEQGSADLVLDPIFAVVNALVGSVLPTIDPVKYIEAEIKDWVTGKVSQQLSSAISNSLPTGGSGGYGSLTSWLGVPYLWGGGHGVSEAVARRLGVDCSGLVDQVYGLTGTTHQQVNMGSAVPSLAASLPGDLAFFSSLAAGEDHHVGIIVVPGGKQMIDAPFTGTVVRYDSTNFDGGPSQIRRLIQAAVTPGAAGGTGDTAGATGNITNATQASIALLTDLGYPVTQTSVASLVKWANAEGGMWHNTATFNPWNTTQREPGSHPINSVGVQAYTSWAQGLGATIATLRNGHYPEILNSLLGGVGLTRVDDANLTTWGTGAIFDQGGLVPPGVSMMVNNTGVGEQLRVISPDGAGLGNVGQDQTEQLIVMIMQNTSALSALVQAEQQSNLVSQSVYMKFDTVVSALSTLAATVEKLTTAMQTMTTAAAAATPTQAATTPADTAAATAAAVVAAVPVAFHQPGVLGAIQANPPNLSGHGFSQPGALGALHFDQGGIVPAGLSLMMNTTGQGEQLRVISPQGAGGGGPSVVFGPGSVQVSLTVGSGGIDAATMAQIRQQQEDATLTAIEDTLRLVNAGNPGGRPS